MRVKKSFLNAFSNSLILIIRAVLLFVVRIVFVKTLGKIYLGVDSLFTNILLVLSIADSGISTAINFSLYKPLSDKDYTKVSVLMTFYKKVYKILGLIVILIGLSMLPFLNIIVKENVSNIHFIFILYLSTTAMTYFISYKDALLNADQNNYKVSFITGGTYIVMYLLRILFLLILPNFIVFVLIQLIMLLIQRVMINRYITKSYKNVDFNIDKKLSKKEQKKIYKSVGSMFLNKIGNYLVTGTDNIIISAFPNLGIALVGIYANYYSITNMTDNIINRGLSGITASFGDLAVNESKEVQENVFNIISFISFFIYGLITIGFWFLLTPLIKICFGNSFGLEGLTLLVICLNFYMIGNVKSLDVIKEATGNYVQDRYANIIQAIINIILSIILGKILGLLGVILATLISCILVPLWNKPYIAYKYIFNKKPFNYYLKQLMYLIVLSIIAFICYVIINSIAINNALLSFAVTGIIIVVIYVLIISLLFFKTNEYKYLFGIFKNMVNKVIKKKANV